MNSIIKPEATEMGFTTAQIDLIKKQIIPGATDDELKLFLNVCHRTGLDPFARQIYAMKRFSKGQDRYDFQVSIDGFRVVAEKTGCYAGNDDPVFDIEEAPQKATVTVYKIVNGIRCPFSASARWSQYYPGEKQGFMWKKMPHVMLGKCAEALALRKAFPNVLSGLYTNDEMAQATKHEEVKDVTPNKVLKEFNPHEFDDIPEKEIFENKGGKLTKNTPVIPLDNSAPSPKVMKLNPDQSIVFMDISEMMTKLSKNEFVAVNEDDLGDILEGVSELRNEAHELMKPGARKIEDLNFIRQGKAPMSQAEFALKNLLNIDHKNLDVLLANWRDYK